MWCFSTDIVFAEILKLTVMMWFLLCFLHKKHRLKRVHANICTWQQWHQRSENDIIIHPSDTVWVNSGLRLDSLAMGISVHLEHSWFSAAEQSGHHLILLFIMCHTFSIRTGMRQGYKCATDLGIFSFFCQHFWVCSLHQICLNLFKLSKRIGVGQVTRKTFSSTLYFFAVKWRFELLKLHISVSVVFSTIFSRN